MTCASVTRFPVRKRQILVLRITLRAVQPKTWRKLRIPDHIRLDEFHLILQWVMGWQDQHMHGFVQGDRIYCDPAEDNGTISNLLDETRHTIGDLLQKVGDRLRYDYDFGDNWEHDVLVEQCLPIEDSPQRPYCMDGRNPCPPEDCGGSQGYAELLAALADPSHPGRRDWLAWVPPDFEPGHFSRRRINLMLKTWSEA